MSTLEVIKWAREEYQSAIVRYERLDRMSNEESLLRPKKQIYRARVKHCMQEYVVTTRIGSHLLFRFSWKRAGVTFRNKARYVVIGASVGTL